MLVGVLLFGPLDWGVEADAPPHGDDDQPHGGPPGPRTRTTTEGGRAVAAFAARSSAQGHASAAEASRKCGADADPPHVRRPSRRSKKNRGPASRARKPGARGQGFGLSAGGGSSASGVQLDVANFCCPEYIEQMVTLIQRNWQQNQGVRGTTG